MLALLMPPQRDERMVRLQRFKMEEEWRWPLPTSLVYGSKASWGGAASNEFSKGGLMTEEVQRSVLESKERIGHAGVSVFLW